MVGESDYFQHLTSGTYGPTLCEELGWWKASRKPPGARSCSAGEAGTFPPLPLPEEPIPGQQWLLLRQKRDRATANLHRQTPANEAVLPRSGLRATAREAPRGEANGSRQAGGKQTLIQQRCLIHVHGKPSSGALIFFRDIEIWVPSSAAPPGTQRKWHRRCPHHTQ